ncbi:MAG: Uncharacterized protein LiPW41_69 [Parcubacteria group bacterium LiPW_41]|nr:MAG: Uncharacterized protein LiPW41_69 [Parcubacteria group bacterium LiPW_41]
MMPAYIKNKIRRSSMKKKLYIGIVAEIGAGKDAVAKYLEVFYQARVLRSSDLLGEILRMLKLDSKKRKNLQKLPIAIRNTFGAHTISKAMVHWMREQKNANIVIWNGIRYPSDVEEFKKLPNSVLIGISADLLKRFKWIKKRKEKSGEEKITYAKFLEEAGQDTEKNVAKIIEKNATYVIQNNKTITSLYKKIAKIIEEEQARLNMN